MWMQNAGILIRDSQKRIEPTTRESINQTLSMKFYARRFFANYTLTIKKQWRQQVKLTIFFSVK